MSGSINKKLILSDNVVFTCQNSGACCRNDWLIGVDTESYSQLKDIAWYDLSSDLDNQDKFKLLDNPLPTGELVTFRRKSCGACVFLTGDTRCSIHNLLGYDRKPQVCKEFPYYFMETPDGVIVGLSFACTAVRSHKGKSLSEQKTDINKILQKSQRIKQLPDLFTLYSDMDIDWNGYKKIESALLDLFRNTKYPFPLILISGSILISVCVSLKQVEVTAKKENKTPNETLESGLEKLAQHHYEPIYGIAAKARNPGYYSLSYLAPFYTWLEFSKNKFNRFMLVWQLYGNYYKFRKGRGVIEDHLTGQGKVEISDIAKIRFDSDSADMDKLLREYWTHVIYRKNIIPQHGIFRGYHTLLLLYAASKWVAKLYACRKGRNKVNLEDLQDSIRILEQHFILHSQFPEIFKINPILTIMIDRFYRKGHFTPAVVLEPGNNK